jgi:hypothetical protein
MIDAMRLTLALLVLASCGGGTIVTPSESKTVQLVRCTVAPAPPAVADAFGSRERAAPRPRGERVASSRIPLVELGRPTIIGALDAEGVESVMQSGLPMLRKCLGYEIAARNINAKTVIQYRLSITANGGVQTASTSSRSLGSTLESCVERVLRGLVFTSSPSGGTTSVTYPLIFDSTRTEPEPAPLTKLDEKPWTPFAIAFDRPSRAAIPTARATEAAIRTKLGAIDSCFAKSATARGSLRALIQLDVEGRPTAVRLGGLGDARGEACAAEVIAGLRVLAPSPMLAEIACDLSRGDARPWRVTPAAGYGVIEASRQQLRYGTQTLARDAVEPPPLADTKTFLVIAEPDTPGAMLELALQWAADDVVVVALRDGAGAPLFLGIGRTGASLGASSVEAVRPTLRLGTRTVTSCVDRSSQQTKLANPVALGTLVQRVADKCKKLSCTGTLALALDAEAKVKDLVEVVGAARRAGFDRILIGGETGCRPIDSP